MAAVKRFVITGGPGAGKSNVLNLLRERGYNCFEEVSRRLIMEEVRSGSGCLPWTDLACFAGKALDRMRESYTAAVQGPAFFDRGIPDVAAYLQVAGLPLPEDLQAACNHARYQSPVFLLPPWKEIYVNDPERWQTYEEAVALHDAIGLVYRHFGYACMRVPPGTVEQRADFILRSIAAVR